jgi:hypothetical protein
MVWVACHSEVVVAPRVVEVILVLLAFSVVIRRKRIYNF